MEIKNVKFKDGKTTVEFKRPNGADHETVTFSTKDEPRKPLKDAFRALRNDLLAFCDLPAEVKEGTELIAVAFSQQKNGDPAVTLSGRRAVPAGTYSISSPLMVRYEEEKGQANALPSTTWKLIQKLLRAAEKFIAGDRVQHELPLDDESTVEAAAGTDA